jgi:hypothetical protein
MLFVAIFAFLAQAGELGIGLDGPAPAGTLWLEQTWDLGDWTFFAYAESALFPFSFGRFNLKLTWNPESLELSPELNLLGSGRVDFLFTASAEMSKSFQDATVVFQAGAKAGWIGLNIAPTPILVTWGFLRWEKGLASAELDLDGPAPWRSTLKIQMDSITLTLGPAISLGFSQDNGAWTETSEIQIFPKALQFHSIRWSEGDREFQVFLSSSGQVWWKAQASQGNWTSSVFFSLTNEGVQAHFELRLAF